MVTRCQKRISGPLMDRIDLHIDVPRVEYEKLTANRRGETSAVIRQRVEAARQRQIAGREHRGEADSRTAARDAVTLPAS